MKVIKLSGELASSKGAYAIVDDDDYETIISMGTWHLSDTGYAVRRSTITGTIRMHRVIARTPKGKLTDHLNHNRLDNRKANLRICTQKENMSNQKGEKGYCFDKSRNKWIVRYKSQVYGRYETEEQARRAYQLAKSGVVYQKREHRKNYHLPTGVFRNKGNRGYQARPQINGKRVYLGTFPTIKEAEEAYLDRKRG